MTPPLPVLKGISSYAEGGEPWDFQLRIADLSGSAGHSDAPCAFLASGGEEL